MHSTPPPPLPTFFVPHGAPTFALQPGAAGQAMAHAASKLQGVHAILIVSAHWETGVPTLGIALKPQTLHDFYGFPQALYTLNYPAPGAVPWAMETRTLLEEAGFEVELDPMRGLDHGAWIPLRLMFPEARLPVFTLSVQSGQDAAYHYRVGQALAPLRQRGVLVLGSGNLTHNLMHFGLLRGAKAPPDYVPAFQEWVNARLAACDVETLLQYRTLAPGAELAHPTDEHWMPFYVALGAAGERFAADRLCDNIEHNMLAMDAYLFRASHEPLSSPHEESHHA